jgi:hemerythrin superfamily protein
MFHAAARNTRPFHALRPQGRAPALPAGSTSMAKAKEEYTDAIMLLKADHRTVEDLFEKFQKAKGDDKKMQIATQICNELKIHTMLEEEIFYPAFRGKIEDDILDEAEVEHDGAKVLINDLMANGPDDDHFEAKYPSCAKRSSIM